MGNSLICCERQSQRQWGYEEKQQVYFVVEDIQEEEEQEGGLSRSIQKFDENDISKLSVDHGDI